MSAYDFEVVSPECPSDLTTKGYSMMLDGAGATTTFGGNYYVNSADKTVTPTVKVRFDAEDGTWTTLAPRKYTLKYEKKTGDNSWEDYTADTFGVDESGTATYRVSARPHIIAVEEIGKHLISALQSQLVGNHL